MLRKGSPHHETSPQEHQKRRRERVLIAISLILVVTITSLEVHLVRQGGQPVTGSLLAFGLLNINTFLLLLFTFLIFRHLSKLFLERRRKVFGSRLRTRLVLAFITLTLMPTLFIFVMSWQLMSSRVDYSWDRQVEQSLEQALAVSRTVSGELKSKLKACGQLVSLELAKREGWRQEEGDSLAAFLKPRLEEFQLTGLAILDPQGTVMAESVAPQAPPFPALALPEIQSTAASQDKIIRQPLPQGELLTLPVPLRDAGGSLAGYVVVRELIPQSQLLQIRRRGQEPSGPAPAAPALQPRQSQPLPDPDHRHPRRHDGRHLAGFIHGPGDYHPHSPAGRRHREGGRGGL